MKDILLHPTILDRIPIRDKNKKTHKELYNTLAPIVPHEPFIAKWKAHPTKSNVIIGTWAEDQNEYEVTCPYQLRESIILMQNELTRFLGVEHEQK